MYTAALICGAYGLPYGVWSKVLFDAQAGARPRTPTSRFNPWHHEKVTHCGIVERQFLVVAYSLSVTKRLKPVHTYQVVAKKLWS